MPDAENGTVTRHDLAKCISACPERDGSGLSLAGPGSSPLGPGLRGHGSGRLEHTRMGTRT